MDEKMNGCGQGQWETGGKKRAMAMTMYIQLDLPGKC
jgi:hypothetical protein